MGRSFIIDDTCTFYANAHTPSTGAAVDADAVPGYRVYEDETGTPILTGSMALLDDTNTVGFYSEQITLSAANGFEYGKSYCIRITIVVGGVTGIQTETIQIGARVDARLHGGTLQTGRDIGASVLLSSGTGTGQIKIASGYVAPDWGDVANKTTTNALTNTTIGTVTTVTTVTNVTNAPTAGDFTATQKTSITTAATAATPMLNSAYDAAKTAASQSSVNAVQTSVNTIAGYVDTEVGAIKNVTDKLDDTLEDQGGGLYGFTAASLIEAPTGGGGGGSGAPSRGVSPCLLKQFETYVLMVFMTDDTTHLGKTGLTLVVETSKAGEAFGTITPTIVPRAYGWYAVILDGVLHVDTVGDMAFHVTGTGANPNDFVVQVRPQVLGDTLTANMTNIAGWFVEVDPEVASSGSITFPVVIPSSDDVWGGLVRSTGTVVTDAANSALTFKTDRAETDDDFWKDSFLTFKDGALSGQTKRITGYTGSFVTTDGYTGTPAAGDTFLLVNV